MLGRDIRSSVYLNLVDLVRMPIPYLIVRYVKKGVTPFCVSLLIKAAISSGDSANWFCVH